MKQIIILSVIFIAFINISYSQIEGTLDTTFDADGKVITDLGFTYDEIYDMAIQNDGKIVVTGDEYDDYFKIARYNPDGSLDSTFGTNGVVITDFGSAPSSNIAIQSDGKIVVAGTIFYNVEDSHHDFCVARYNTDGTIDTTFGSMGMVTTEFVDTVSADDQVRGMAIQSDGKIVVAGIVDEGTTQWNFAMARYNMDGSLDLSFGENGKVITHFYTQSLLGNIDIQPDGKIILCGSLTNNALALARYNSDGSLDSSFGNDGKVIDYSVDLAVETGLQSDGKIVCFGNKIDNGERNFCITRYDVNGYIDTDFGNDGYDILNFDLDLSLSSGTIQSNDKIVVAGVTNPCTDSSDFVLAKYHQDGVLDTNFGDNGVVVTDFGASEVCTSVALQEDDKIVAAGYQMYETEYSNAFDYALARYNAKSITTKENNETNNMISIFPNPTTSNVIVSVPDNAIIEVLNMKGKNMKTITHNNEYTSINLSDLPCGMYIIRVTTGEYSLTRKVIIE
ncbi:MAG: T9SS type A sorting domain-containing protein [Bacteroidales bacterium]